MLMFEPASQKRTGKPDRFGILGVASKHSCDFPYPLIMVDFKNATEISIPLYLEMLIGESCYRSFVGYQNDLTSEGKFLECITCKYGRTPSKPCLDLIEDQDIRKHFVRGSDLE